MEACEGHGFHLELIHIQQLGEAANFSKEIYDIEPSFRPRNHMEECRRVSRSRLSGCLTNGLAVCSQGGVERGGWQAWRLASELEAAVRSQGPDQELITVTGQGLWVQNGAPSSG